MSTLDRELVLRVGIAFLTAYGGLLGLILLFQVGRAASVALGADLAWADALVILVGFVPMLSVLVLPLAVLVGQLVGLGILASHGAIAALASVGVSPGRWARGPVLLGIAVALAGMVNAHLLAPAGCRALKRRLGALVVRNLAQELRSRAGSAIVELPGGSAMYAGRPGDGERLADVLLWMPGRSAMTASVAEIRVEGGRLFLRLAYGTLRGGTQDLEVFFNEAHVSVRVSDLVEASTQWIGELPATRSVDLLRRGAGGRDPARRRMLRDFWRRFSLPGAALPFSLLAVALIDRLGRYRLVWTAVGGPLAVLLHYAVGRLSDDAINRTQGWVAPWVMLPDLSVLALALLMGWSRAGGWPGPLRRRRAGSIVGGSDTR